MAGSASYCLSFSFCGLNSVARRWPSAICAGLQLLRDQVALRDASGIALGRADIQPLVSLHVVALHALAGAVHGAQIVLGLGVILLGGPPEPVRGFRGTLRNAVAVQVQQPQVVLRDGIACLRQRTPFFRGADVIAFLIRVQPGLENRPTREWRVTKRRASTKSVTATAFACRNAPIRIEAHGNHLVSGSVLPGRARRAAIRDSTDTCAGYTWGWMWAAVPRGGRAKGEETRSACPVRAQRKC